MARGRILYPDFWTDGKMTKLSPLARLLYIGSWNFSYCDKGHLPDDADDLKLKILPADDVDPGVLLEEIISAGRMVRITAANKSYLFIPTFFGWQKADTRWKSRCPVCVSEAPPKPSKPQPSLVEHTETQPDSALRGGEGKGEERKGGEGTTPTPFCSKHPEGTDTPCSACMIARRAYTAWHTSATAPKPTVSGIVTPTDCVKHPHYPARNCDRCAEENAAAAS